MDCMCDTKSVTSGVPDAYIKPDTNRQIFSVPRVYDQGDRAIFEADLPGMHFSIDDDSVIIPFIGVDHEGDESIGPKWLVSCY